MRIISSDQPAIIETLLNAHPDKQRIIFVHIPKCAGTDLSANLVKLYPASIHETITHPAWTPPEKLQDVVDSIEASVDKSLHILVHGHIRLRWVVNRKLSRQGDRLFTIVRNPHEALLSQINYVVGALMTDPNGTRTDTHMWLRAIGVKDVEGWPARDVAAAAAKLIHKNPMCHALGSDTAESALSFIRASGIEITDTSRYSRWAEGVWGSPFTTRHNISQKIVTEVPQNVVAQSCAEDMELYAVIMRAMKEHLSVCGERV